MPVTTLYLVRHGATDANMARPYILQGRGVNLSLNSTGRAQAASVGQFLSSQKIDHVYASVLKRAVETAEAIAAPHHLPVEVDERITECHVGQWEGLDWESIRARNPDAWSLFNEDPSQHPYLGGESYRDVLHRVEPALMELLQRHPGESIAVIAHNIVNRVFLAQVLGLELRRAKELRQSNAGVNVLHYDEGRLVVETMNSCFHLPRETR